MASASRRIWLKLGLVSAILAQTMPAAAAPTAEGRQLAEGLLVGTWRLVSYQLRNGRGEVIYPMGPHAQGQIIYDSVGNMSCHLFNPNPSERPQAGNDGAAYEARISYDRHSSYFGPYEVDASKREVRHRVLGSSMPGWAGTSVVRSYALDGEDRLTLSANTGAGDQRAVLIWERAK